MDQVGEVAAVDRPRLERPPVDDDPRGLAAAARQQPAEGHAAARGLVEHDVGVVRLQRGDRRHVLDGELDLLELAAPALLEVLDRVEHELVEALAAGLRRRHPDVERADPHHRGDERSAQATAVPVAAAAGGRAHGARLATRGRAFWPLAGARGYGRPVSPVRRCSRSACASPAVATLTYVYADSTAVLGPLAMHAEPHCYDLCERHAERLTAPRGWEVVRHETDPPDVVAARNADDLVALADAVREAARPSQRYAGSGPAAEPATGRRGHLRSVPAPS